MTGISFVPEEMSAWRSRGACNGLDPDLFFPSVNENAPTAKRVCADCPVIRQCGEWAIAHNEQSGVWGGMSEKERKRIRRQRKEGTAA